MTPSPTITKIYFDRENYSLTELAWLVEHFKKMTNGNFTISMTLSCYIEYLTKMLDPTPPKYFLSRMYNDDDFNPCIMPCRFRGILIFPDYEGFHEGQF